jgi:hypothetical protein
VIYLIWKGILKSTANYGLISQRRIKVLSAEIDPSLIRHSEYDIEVSNTDNLELKNANKLVIIPVLEYSDLEFRRNKQTLLSLPIKTIENITISIPEANLKGDNNPILKITFNDSNSSSKSITLNIKNRKNAPRIQQQILLLKEAAQNDSVRKSIMSSLNPKLQLMFRK